MANRKVKDGIDLLTNELIYFRGHAKVTYLSDGSTVEDKINEILENENDLTNYYTKDEIENKGYANKSELNSKQETLVSGTNVKTINGQSILGSGDLKIATMPLSTSTSSTMSLSPNIYYRNTSTSLTSLSISLGNVTDNTIINEYFIEFTTSSNGTTISLPNTIKWANGEIPTFEANTTYQISIINNLGVCMKFK